MMLIPIRLVPLRMVALGRRPERRPFDEARSAWCGPCYTWWQTWPIPHEAGGPGASHGT